MENFKITVIGGGTGSFVVLRDLKKFPVDLTAVVTVSDSGGSTGRLRSEFGFLPVGDLRQCLAALSDDSDDTLIKLLTYRFDRGRGLRGHNLGNLILTGLRDIYGSEPKALEKASSIFKITGRVLPVSLLQATLGVTYENGKRSLGEHAIDEPEFGGGVRIKGVYLTPKIRVYKASAEAIIDCDMIVLGPGDIYTSTIPCLLVEGVEGAIKKSRAKICYVMNLMNRYSQTHNFKASDYLREIEKYLGRKVDFIIINKTKPSKKVLEKYRREKASEITDDLPGGGWNIIRGDFSKKGILSKDPGDVLSRSFYRHDGDKLARALIKILL